MKILEIWCWNKKLYSDSIGLDCSILPWIDVVHNLDIFPYPFKDGEFDEIYAYMVLEHVNDFIKTMKELHRIIRKWWLINIKVPYYLSTGAFSDPTHKTFFTEETFDFFTNNHSLNYYTNIRFQIIEKKLFAWDNLLGKLRQIIPWSGFLKYIIMNYFTEIHFTLKKI